MGVKYNKIENLGKGRICKRKGIKSLNVNGGSRR
jgi:hypothetical protein